MKNIKSCAFFLSAIITAFATIPTSAVTSGSVDNKYGYSGAWTGDLVEKVVVKGDPDFPGVDDSIPEFMAIIKGLKSKNSKNQNIDIVYGLRNFQAFEHCTNAVTPKSILAPYVAVETAKFSELVGAALDNDLLSFNFSTYCGNAEFYLNYYIAGTVDESTGAGTPANINDGAFAFYDLDNAGEARDYDFANNGAVANYGEERFIFKSGTINQYYIEDATLISVENNTVSAIATDPTGAANLNADITVDGFNNQLVATLSARNGYFGAILNSVSPARIAAPVKSASAYEAIEGGVVDFTVEQDIPFYPQHGMGLTSIMVLDSYYGNNAMPDNFKATNSANEDITEYITVWTLPNTNDPLAKDSFYYVCSSDGSYIVPSCLPNEVSAGEFLRHASNDDSAFLPYLASKFNVSTDELYALIYTMSDELTLSDFFANLGASASISNKTMPLYGEHLTFSYQGTMPSGISTLSSEVASLDEIDSNVRTHVGNKIAIRITKKNPKTGDLNIASISVVTIISLSGLALIFRKSGTRR